MYRFNKIALTMTWHLYNLLKQITWVILLTKDYFILLLLTCKIWKYFSANSICIRIGFTSASHVYWLSV